MSVSIQNAVQELWKLLENDGHSPEQAKRIIYRELMGKGVSFREISNALNKSTITLEKSTVVAHKLSDKFRNCPVNDDGYVIDPISLEEIPEDLLITYKSNGHNYCFNISNLYRLSKTKNEMINPLNREQLPKHIIDQLLDYGKMNEKSINIVYKSKEINLQLEFFTAIGELIVNSIRMMEGSFIENMTEYDVIGPNKKSLYFSNLEDSINNSLLNLKIESFSTPLHRSDSLLEMYDFCKKRRGTETYNSLYLHLGGILSMVPVIRVEGGLNYTVLPESRIIDVMLTSYEFLGGMHKMKEYDIVLENGRSLSKFRLDGLAINLIPSENIFHIPYENQMKKMNNLMKINGFAFNYNMRNIVEESSQRPTEIDYNLSDVTLSDVINDEDTLTQLIDSGAYTLSESEDFIILAIESNKIYKIKFRWPLIYKPNIKNFTKSIIEALLLKGDRRIFEEILDIYDRNISDKSFLHSVLRNINVSIVPMELMVPFYTARVYKSGFHNYIIVDMLLSGNFNKLNPSANLIGRLDNGKVFIEWLKIHRPNSEIIECLSASLRYHGHEIIDVSIHHVTPLNYFSAVNYYGTIDQFKSIFVGKSREEFNELFIAAFTAAFTVNSQMKPEMMEFLIDDDRLDKESVNIVVNILAEYPLNRVYDAFLFLINHPFFTDYRSLAAKISIANEYPVELVIKIFDRLSDDEVRNLLYKIIFSDDIFAYLLRRGIEMPKL